MTRKLSAVERILLAASRSKRLESFRYDKADNTLHFKGVVDFPITGFNGDVKVAGQLTSNLDISGDLTIVDDEKLLLQMGERTGIVGNGNRIRAANVTVENCAGHILGKVDIVTGKLVSYGHIDGDGVNIECNDLWFNHLRGGAQVTVNGPARGFMHHQVNIDGDPLFHNSAKRPTQLIAHTLDIGGKIDGKSVVVVQGDAKVRYGLTGGAKLACGGSFEGQSVGAAVGHGTSHDAVTYLYAGRDVKIRQGGKSKVVARGGIDITGPYGFEVSARGMKRVDFGPGPEGVPSKVEPTMPAALKAAIDMVPALAA
ncbi:MAG: hypothetical protein AB7G06_06440 [Bdellovibrionales bacterium]